MPHRVIVAHRARLPAQVAASPGMTPWAASRGVTPEPTHVLVAVKDLPEAKTRLAPDLGEAYRGELVLAMLSDTLAAALACPEVAAVHVVTRDPVVAATARAGGAHVVDDRAAGLNAALRAGAEAVLAQHPGVRLAALQADLPALRAGELATALRRAGARAFVADTQGTGTTLLVARGPLDPRFGPGSAAAHRESADALDGVWPGLRGDVDTVDDLAAALLAGVGPATAALTDRYGVVATVARHDVDGVRLRTDDGRELFADNASAARGGWRQLRDGQRLRAHPGADGSVLLLTTAGAGLPG